MLIFVVAIFYQALLLSKTLNFSEGESSFFIKKMHNLNKKTIFLIRRLD